MYETEKQLVAYPAVDLACQLAPACHLSDCDIALSNAEMEYATNMHLL